MIKPPTRLPLIITFLLLIIGGWFLLDRSAALNRDTTRKHHLEDIEKSLYSARDLHGTYPPYELPTWCGLLSDPKNQAVHDQVESALRAQNEKYANPDKPFPTDPLAGQTPDYFYWKRSPASFQLFSVLEQDQNGDRNTANCPNAPELSYDYGLTSVLREKDTNL